MTISDPRRKKNLPPPRREPSLNTKEIMIIGEFEPNAEFPDSEPADLILTLMRLGISDLRIEVGDLGAFTDEL